MRERNLSEDFGRKATEASLNEAEQARIDALKEGERREIERARVQQDRLQEQNMEAARAEIAREHLQPHLRPDGQQHAQSRHEIERKAEKLVDRRNEQEMQAIRNAYALEREAIRELARERAFGWSTEKAEDTKQKEQEKSASLKETFTRVR
jgi:hypothetical protein